MLPSETMIWQPEFTDKILSRKPGAVHGYSIDGFLFYSTQVKSRQLRANHIRCHFLEWHW
ncbi:hypothetical protein D3P03_27040 [Escherichia coli]|nr:hypothetical protein D3P03_27040 [Escherichia coli]